MRNSLLIIAGITLLCGAVHADNQPPAQNACLRDNLCRTHYMLARELSKNGQLIEALDAYDAAYRRQPMPMLIFNMARLHHRLNHFTEAIRYYSLYMEAQPLDPLEQRNRARELMEQVTKQMQQAAPAASPTTPQPAPPPAEPDDKPANMTPAELPDPPPAPPPAPPSPLPAANPLALAISQGWTIIPMPKDEKKDKGELYKKWWFWSAVGAVVGITLVGIVAGTRYQGPPIVLHPTK